MYWEDHMGKITIAVFVLVMGVVVLCVAATVHQEQKAIDACIAIGGQWKQTGSHITTTYVKSGNVLIPLENTTKEFGCVR